ncbi:ankyrin [Penicillium brevicompactum]|uniref:Ankyrin n=1 Tax=Penicillium brevicompactum TaxID=5074 RepID=A0A9W9QMR8_PENBR|nr:ankyrin [Penicillium brevicompactum]
MSVKSVPAQKFSMDMYNHDLPPSFEYCLCCTPPSTTEKDSLEVVDWLMQHDRVLASCSRRAPRALTLAIIQGKSCVVRHLMKRFPACVNDPAHKDIRPEWLDCVGRSALWHAVNTCNLQLIRRLAEFPRIQTNVPDHQGVSPLARAMIRRRLDIFNWLLATFPQNIARG